MRFGLKSFVMNSKKSDFKNDIEYALQRKSIVMIMNVLSTFFLAVVI